MISVKDNELVKEYRKTRKVELEAKRKRIVAEMALVNSRIEWICEDGRKE